MSTGVYAVEFDGVVAAAAADQRHTPQIMLVYYSTKRMTDHWTGWHAD